MRTVISIVARVRTAWSSSRSSQAASASSDRLARSVSMRVRYRSDAGGSGAASSTASCRPSARGVPSASTASTG